MRVTKNESLIREIVADARLPQLPLSTLIQLQQKSSDRWPREMWGRFPGYRDTLIKSARNAEAVTPEAKAEVVRLLREGMAATSGAREQ